VKMFIYIEYEQAKKRTHNTANYESVYIQQNYLIYDTSDCLRLKLDDVAIILKLISQLKQINKFVLT